MINRRKLGYMYDDGVSGAYWAILIIFVVITICIIVNNNNDNKWYAELSSCRDGYKLGCISAIQDYNEKISYNSKDIDAINKKILLREAWREHTGKDIVVPTQ